MKYILLFIFSIFSYFSVYAQLDSEKKSTTIPAEEKKDAKDPSLIIKPIENKGLSGINEEKINGLSVPKNEQALDVKEEEFSMFGEKFGNPAELFEKKIKKNLRVREEGETQQYGSTTNQFLGDFKTNAAFVNVVYRDHEYFDGDRIRVFVNDDVVQPNILLESEYKGFKLNLKPGFNKIDFQALNQGTSGPNTAEFQIMDDNDVIISSNRWNLATGVMATIMLVKE